MKDGYSTNKDMEAVSRHLEHLLREQADVSIARSEDLAKIHICIERSVDRRQIIDRRR